MKSSPLLMAAVLLGAAPGAHPGGAGTVAHPGADEHTIVFEGRRLVLNVAAEGSLSVGLLDEAGHPIPGFALDECDPVSVDSTRKTVRWRGQEDVSRLAGKVVHLQLRMQKAKLFALQFISGDSARRENDLTSAGGWLPGARSWPRRSAPARARR